MSTNLAPFGEQTFDPLKRVRDAALGDRAGPHPPHRERQALRIALALREPEDRRRVLADLGSCPSAQSRPGSVERFTDRQLDAIALPGGRKSIDQRQSFLEMGHGFLQGHPPDRQGARFPPQRNRSRKIPCLRVVMREPLGLVGHAIGEIVLQHVRNPGVQFAAPALEKRVVGGILDQCMLELVSGIGLPSRFE